jgi:hypothetical protein
VKCAYTLGAVPHITAGSWQVTPEELKEARAGLAEAVAGLEPVDVEVTLHEECRDGFCAYYLIVTNREALMAFHAGLHEALDYPYETFREIDLPGQWWPHLTLFSVPESNRDAVAEALDKLREVSRVRVERLGLVTFGPIEVVAEARLAGEARSAGEPRPGRAVYEDGSGGKGRGCVEGIHDKRRARGMDGADSGD